MIKLKVIILKDFAHSFLYPQTTVTTKFFVGDNIIGMAFVVLSCSDWLDLSKKLHNKELTTSNMKAILAALFTWYIEQGKT